MNHKLKEDIDQIFADPEDINPADPSVRGGEDVDAAIVWFVKAVITAGVIVILLVIWSATR